MKKGILSICLLSSLLFSADNEIKLIATVLPGAVVGLSDVSSESLAQSKPVVKDMTVNLGTINKDEVLQKVTMPIFVKTNTSGVSIPIDESRYNDKLYQAIKEKEFKLSLIIIINIIIIFSN